LAHGAKFVEYKGKQIYIVDYSKIITNEEFLAVIKQTNAFREKTKSEEKRDLLMLADTCN
jgi:hypothetical protein